MELAVTIAIDVYWQLETSFIFVSIESMDTDSVHHSLQLLLWLNQWTLTRYSTRTSTNNSIGECEAVCNRRYRDGWHEQFKSRGSQEWSLEVTYATRLVLQAFCRLAKRMP